MQLKTTHTPHIHLNSLTFFGLEICCIYSMAGPRICSFFAIKTFIGGSPLFWIFKPIESSSAQNNPLAAVYTVCVCVWMSPYCFSPAKWLWLGEHLKPYGKRKACTADVSSSAEGWVSCQDTQFSTWQQVRKQMSSRTVLLTLWMAGGTWVWDGDRGLLFDLSGQVQGWANW